MHCSDDDVSGLRVSSANKTIFDVAETLTRESYICSGVIMSHRSLNKTVGFFHSSSTSCLNHDGGEALYSLIVIVTC